MHVIDDTSRGADGTRLGDLDGDGLPDIVTGWEEGGVVRAYVNPGPEGVRRPWPAVTVGRVKSPEDAVFADVDGDGATDVVSSTEGRTRTVFVHLAPREKGRLLDAKAWRTSAVEPSRGARQWMFCAPLDVDGRGGIDLVLGAKGKGAEIGWYESPLGASRREGKGSPAGAQDSEWKWHPIRGAGWIMSLAATDMDGDGDLDVLYSDRKGGARGVGWLENPGPARAASRWKDRVIGARGREVMFLTEADLDRDGLQDVIAAVKPRDLIWFRREGAPPGQKGTRWKPRTIPFPESAGTAKAVAAGDIDLDGRTDLVFTCEHANEGRPGVMWMSCKGDAATGRWSAHELSGPRGIKFDLARLVDLDGDGDPDVVTCEEREMNAIVWYENPAR